MNEIALIGKKLGMTREFLKTGQLVPVTVIKMEKARVISVIEKDIQAAESTADFNVRRGISVEIDEQDKIRSIVNKYLK